MGSSGIFDESDLLSLAPPELQRALLKVPDDLVAQALSGAREPVAARIMENLSPRRARAVQATARRLVDSRELGPQAAKTALRNLVRKVFDVAALEAEGPAASRSVGAARPAAAVGAPAGGRASEANRRPGPDLSPRAFARLREVRAVLDAARKASPFVRELERARLGASATVLAGAWLRR